MVSDARPARGRPAMGASILLAWACAGVEPSGASGEARADPPRAQSSPSASDAIELPAALADSPPGTDAVGLQPAWTRVDVLFDRVLRWSTRADVLSGLDETAIDRHGRGQRVLSFQTGVTGFVPDPSCDPERAKCGDIPTWADGGGIYLHLRAHHQLYAAGIFDASYEIGPLTLDVRLFASDPALRSALLRDLGLLLGHAPSVPAGCPAIAEQIASWRRDDLRQRRQPEAAAVVKATLDDLEPAHDLLDLDGDGRFELVLEQTYGDNRDHYFFAEQQGCPRLVAVIHLWPVSGISCRRVPQRALCDLHTSQLMVHGDEQGRVWTFDGTRYVEATR